MSKTGRRIMGVATTMALLLDLGGGAWAANAGDLGGSLTPIGAERAGNADGTIPDWTGGDREPEPGWKVGDPRIDRYAAEKKLFTIDASNIDKYSDKLSQGQIEMIKRHAGYRMDVYPTHRSCGYSQSIYDATKANVGQAKLSENGAILSGHGGFLFPLPENGLQVMANYRTAFGGLYVRHKVNMAVEQAGGSYFVNTGVVTSYAPFFEKSGGDTNGEYMTKFVYKQTAPAASVGSIIMTLQPYDGSNESWVYVPGLRRVKKAPTANYDTPVPGQDDLRTFDQTYMFNGLPDRYTWKLLGKKEVYVPYNAARVRAAGIKISDIVKNEYPNRDLARYELHRVWVVEGTAKPGYRATFSRRVFYIDEDTWTPVVADLYDTKDQLWRFQENHLFMASEVPACVTAVDYYYDLNANRYIADDIIIDGESNYTAEGIVANDMFSPDAMRRDGLR